MRYRSSRVALVAVAALGLLLGCGEDDLHWTPDLTPPTFGSIAVSPDPARIGDTLTITITSSEPLAAIPTVTVAGNAATFVSAAGAVYTYSYVVQGTETDGTVTISVSGTDAAGNAGAGVGSVTITRFTDIGAGLTGVDHCSLAWGDYDDDGDLDLALAGHCCGAL